MISVLMEAAVRALLVALTVWIGLRIFRVRNVLAQKIAWGLVLVCAVAMPMLMQWRILPASMALNVPVAQWRMTARQIMPDSLPILDALLLSSHAEVLVDAPQARLVAAPEPVYEYARTGGDRFPAPSISSSEFTTAEPARPAEDQLQVSPVVRKSAVQGIAKRFMHPGMLAGVLYFVVCAGLLIRIALGLAMAVKLWSAAEVFVPRPILNPETGLEMELGIGLHMRFSRAVSSPVTIGSGVLLPADCLDWDAEKLRIVLAHERAHVRQRDFHLQLLGGIYTAVFWFSPLGWWLKRELSDLAEAISDRAGLEEAASRTSYAQVLLEFAALPRPTVLGVAMARNRNLSHRIERFLNETTFRQAFAGGRRRMLLVMLLVPVALFAGTAFVRVEATATPQAVPPPAPPVALNPVEPSNPVEPPVPPSAEGTVIPAGAPPMPAAPSVVPTPPAPPTYGEIHDAADDRAVSMYNDQDNASTNTSTSSNGKHYSGSVGKGYSYSYSSDGESWALVTDPSERVTFSGDWHDSTRDSIKKVRQLTGGKFLWFTHDGKDYFLDDAALISQIQAMYKPMEELERQQEVLGKQQEELGRQQEALGRKQEQASIPTPDISKEMAKLNEAVAKLDAKKGSTVSSEELADIEGKIGDIQGRLGELQGEVGKKQGEFGEQQGKLGEQQGKLGEEQGRLGEKQGRIGEEADRKIRSIMEESLRNGKARPVQ